MQIPVALQQEPVAQNAEDIGTQRDVSDHIQARIAPARLKQAAERFAKIAIAEIVEVSATLCRLNQLLQRNASADFAIKHRAKSVKRANDHRRTETIDGGGRLHWARMFQLRCRRRKYNHQRAMVSRPPIYTNGRFGIAAPGIKIVGRAFLLAGLKFKGKRERLPYRCSTARPQFLLPTASCATHSSVSSLVYGNGESDVWSRLFLGSGRSLSQIKRGN